MSRLPIRLPANACKLLLSIYRLKTRGYRSSLINPAHFIGFSSTLQLPFSGPASLRWLYVSAPPTRS